MVAEQAIQVRKTQVFDPVAKSYEINVMSVLAAFLRKGRSIGLTEDDLTKGSGLTRDEALNEVAKLEKDGFVRSSFAKKAPPVLMPDATSWLTASKSSAKSVDRRSWLWPPHQPRIDIDRFEAFFFRRSGFIHK